MKYFLSAAIIATLVLWTNYTVANARSTEMSVAAVNQAQSKLVLNQASVDQLTAVPGLGRVKAQAIVDHIATHGAITSEAELTKVRGIGEKLAERVAQFVSFD